MYLEILLGMAMAYVCTYHCISYFEPLVPQNSFLP